MRLDPSAWGIKERIHVLNWVFGSKRSKGGEKTAPPYEEAREIAGSGSNAKRAALATCEDLPPEFLYYFASDKDAGVRAAVAGNPGTPLHADVILAKDRDVAVRSVLATKITKMLPDINPDESEKLAELAFEVLESLAVDQDTQIRQIVAEFIKSLDNVPKPIVHLLARDLEEVVSMPVLEYSPMLDEQDLLGLLLAGIGGKRLAAVSPRGDLTSGLIDAIVETEDEVAVQALIGNERAAISDQTLNQIVDAARTREGWQSALATRVRIKEGTLLRLAKFATNNVLQRLKDRSDLGPELHAELETAVTERVNEKIDLPEPASAREKVSPEAETLQKIKEMHKAGKLTERDVLTAIENDNRLFADAALAVLADQSIGRVREVLKMKSAKSILALTWRAGLSMSTAVSIQEKILHLPTSKIMRAGPKGIYPISDDDLSWQAELLFD